MNPICVTCSKEMRCKKNGVTVAPSSNPYWQRKGDMFACDCGNSVVIGFGVAMDDTENEADILIGG
jgi:hypothetical protein